MPGSGEFPARGVAIGHGRRLVVRDDPDQWFDLGEPWDDGLHTLVHAA